jgi:hypothetical protein
MTLSYKWAADATAAASTTTANLSTRLDSLDASSLPLLFLHAIEAAHKLHVPYIWIDAICILQDSEKEFDKEAAMMGKIYRNSYCTISAGLKGTAELGLFRVEDAQNDAVEFELRNESGSMKKVRAVKAQGWWETMFGKGPLRERGWCLQERELSPRVLHFTPTQVLWECRTHKASEGHLTRNTTLKGDQARMLDLISALSVPEIHMQWHHIVQSYTSRHLTEYTDTFPALAASLA